MDRAPDNAHWYCLSDISRGMLLSCKSPITLGVLREFRGVSEQFRLIVADADTGLRMNSFVEYFPGNIAIFSLRSVIVSPPNYSTSVLR